MSRIFKLPPSERSLAEDSEPERIMIRGKMAPNSRTPIDLGVIEVLDSDSEPGTPTAAAPLPLPSGVVLADSESPIPPSRTGEDPESEIDTPMILRTFQAADFAYPLGLKPSQKSSRASTSLLPSRANTPDDALPGAEPPRKSTRPKKTALELSSTYTDKDIDKVLHCIACDAKWTARKSSAQKSDHMRKCCKKAGYTQATIDSLLRKALQDAPPLSSKGKAADLVPPPASPTLLAVMHPPEKRKRGRAQVKSTVTDPRDTRDDIRNRAMQFLNDPGEPSSLAGHNGAGIPATQAFGQSKLGAARATKSLFATDDSASDEECPLPTQKFSKSRLGAARPMKSLLAADESSTSGSDAEHTGSPSKKKRSQGTRFSPSLASADHETEALVPILAAASLHDRPRVGRPKSKSPKRPKHTKRTRTTVVYDAAWEEQLRHKILENKDLHLRILRFEPIFITEFLNLLDAGDKPNAKLVKHVSAYLDKEGIIFCSLARWGKK